MAKTWANNTPRSNEEVHMHLGHFCGRLEAAVQKEKCEDMTVWKVQIPNFDLAEFFQNLFEQSTIVRETPPQSTEVLQDISYRLTRETEKRQEAESRLAALIHDNVRKF